MKKTILLLITLLVSINDVSADGHHHGGDNWWIAPAIIGGAAALTYGLTRPAPPPVYYNPYPTYPSYPTYHYEWIFDPYCQCRRQVVVPNY